MNTTVSSMIASALRLAAPSAPVVARSSSTVAKGKARALTCGPASVDVARAIGTTSTSQPEHPVLPLAPAAPRVAPSTLVPSTADALQLLRSQPNRYVLASLAGRVHLLAPQDLLTVPRLKDVEVGDVLELERVHEVGSRDYTLRAQEDLTTRKVSTAQLIERGGGQEGAAALARALQNMRLDPRDTQQILQQANTESRPQSWAARLGPRGLAKVGAVLDPSVVRVRCVVTEHAKGPLELTLKKKRRKGYKKTIEHKGVYTRLRVDSIELGGQ